MDADDHPVEVVLKEARRFMVPLYQRKYQWGDERLLPFWEDVVAKAAEVVEGESKFEHYMGALILAPVDNAAKFAFTPIVQVVDGQQRLTTFQLFLAALREVARTHGQDHLIDEIKPYLTNEPKGKDTDPLTRFKLTPTPSDRDLFHDIIDLTAAEADKKYKSLFWGKSVPKNRPERAFRAYHLFRQWIEDFVQHGPQDFEGTLEEPEEVEERIDEGITPEDVSARLEALLSALLDRLKLVVITLGESDDAQVIFETLNSKGQPLLAMDLVRNNIFHRAEKQKAKVETLYKKLWDPLDHPWWREPAPNARPKRPRLDHFLAHMLAAETGQKISIRELYAEYRDFAVPKGRPRFENVEDELQLLEQYAPVYRTLEGQEDCNPSLKWLGRKLTTWQVTTVYPVALQMGQDGVSPEEREQLAQLIYSYLVRRTLCNFTTKNLNKVFQSIAAEFLEKGVSVASFKGYFANKAGVSSRFPTDREVRHGILNENAYAISPRPRLVDILWEMELASKSTLAEKTEQPQGLWVEHVLPQSWGDAWPFEDGTVGQPSDDDGGAIARNTILHTLGNLTLLTGGLNISSGNKSFDEKKAKFAEHTGLFLNKWFADKPQWTEAEIRERGEHFADLAIKRWLGLEGNE
ncbi:DUF262 domain-containing protein [Ruegeria arenilitoris]|uniref:DUF262 domain-containing protein n=1 Tax=Ruegeria arenilitoris TaxID=1173585 RepID=UPI00148093CE|nr:DUF262 domain-containing protein [Ruegeria arenilitoris]